MPAKVRDWMSKPAVVIDPDSTVSYALTLMRRRNIHSVIINVDPANNKYGIITSTDIRDKIIAQDRDPADTRAAEIMSAPLVSANPDWTLKECSIEMHKHQIHHMPVADEYGNLIGLISATDIFMAAEEIGWHSS
jgi:signal-transduction protein with cAMP-binding, CBS, and nucleotidyltransferase domain